MIPTPGQSGPSSTERDNLRVVLVSTRNPLNLGAAARAMSNFGFPHLRVVNPFDMAFREARSAVGAADVLAHAEVFSNVAAAIADCNLVVATTAARNRAPEQPIQTLEEGGQLIRDHLRGSPCALLFGSEKVGLPAEDLDHCHFLLRVPTRTERPSMNLGQAVAVCLYEIAREAHRSAPEPKPEAARADELELVTTTLLETLKSCGYVKPGTEASTESKVRRMIRRMNLGAADAPVLLGMLRRMIWAMRQK
jgi:tRNA/rRNA methyltransferase